MLLRIDHATEYRYREPVEFTPHLLRFLPRTTPGLRILRADVQVFPEASVRWNLDADGNVLGKISLPGKSRNLRILSTMVLEQSLCNPFDFLLEERALHLPVRYNGRERVLLSPFLEPGDMESWTEIAGLIRPFLNGVCAKPSTLDFLTSFNRAIPALFRYQERHEEGVRSAEETITKGEGTCRDFAHLLIEAARQTGMAARYVSGYLCFSPGAVGESHTHGWCEVYLPGAGWRGFDPTNGILAGPHHVAVATSAVAGEIPPVEGSYCGIPGLCVAHDVTVSARELLPGEAP